MTRRDVATFLPTALVFLLWAIRPDALRMLDDPTASPWRGLALLVIILPAAVLVWSRVGGEE